MKTKIKHETKPIRCKSMIFVLKKKIDLYIIKSLDFEYCQITKPHSKSWFLDNNHVLI